MNQGGGLPAVAVRDWPPEAVLALDDLARDDGVTVIAVRTRPSPLREEARQAIRAALRELLGQRLGLPASAISLTTVAGSAPMLDLPGQSTGRSWGLSISHDVGLVLAAVDCRGAVGIDHMGVIDLEHALPDWQDVARDYLGPQACARLAALRGEARSLAFAREWTHFEAALKCKGLGLREWSTAHAAVLELPGLALQFSGNGWSGCMVRGNAA